MNRNSYRMLALVLVFAMMLGVTMSMMPAAAQAHSPGGPSHGGPMYHGSMHTGSARFNSTHPPRVIIRDPDDRQVWWGYKLHGDHYVRKFWPKKYGDVEVDYSLNHRGMWAQYASPSP